MGKAKILTDFGGQNPARNKNNSQQQQKFEIKTTVKNTSNLKSKQQSTKTVIRNHNSQLKVI